MDRAGRCRDRPPRAGGHRRPRRARPRPGPGREAPGGAGPDARGRRRGHRDAYHRGRLRHSAPPRLCAARAPTPPRMIAAVLWIGLLGTQAQPAGGPAPPTVGDTIWVRRAVQLPGGYTARAAAWELEGDVELLGRAELIVRADSAIVRYPLVAWTPGSHSVAVPSPILLGADGSLDSLPPARVSFSVASVLPDVPDSAIRPQPGAGLVARPAVSFWPPLLLAGAALLLLAPLHWWWRRRGRPLPAPTAPEPTPVPIERWADAGEARSVLALASARLRTAIGAAEPEAHEGLDSAECVRVLRARRPSWPVDEIADALDALDAMRFAPASAG